MTKLPTKTLTKRKYRMTREHLIFLYYGKGMTLQAIGDAYGVTRERVRQKMEQWELPRNTKRGGRKVWEVKG